MICNIYMFITWLSNPLSQKPLAVSARMRHFLPLYEHFNVIITAEFLRIWVRCFIRHLQAKGGNVAVSRHRKNRMLWNNGNNFCLNVRYINNAYNLMKSKQTALIKDGKQSDNEGQETVVAVSLVQQVDRVVRAKHKFQSVSFSEKFRQISWSFMFIIRPYLGYRDSLCDASKWPTRCISMNFRLISSRSD